MDEQINKELKSNEAARTFFKIIIFMCICVVLLCVFSSKKSDPSRLTVAEFKEKYPYTIDNLRLFCEKDAVWLMDSKGYKYPLNGTAINKLKSLHGTKDIKEILKSNSEDESPILKRGLELCK